MKNRWIAFLCALIVTVTVLSGCGKGGSTLPPLGALAGLPESELNDVLRGYKRDDLRLSWGTPERSMDAALGDTWNLDEQRELTVLYDETGKVFIVMVRKP